MNGGAPPGEQQDLLLQRIREGEMAALTDLYRSCRNMVRAHVTRNSGSTEEADDILQDALVVFWQRVRSNRFEQKAQPGTFVFAVARNLWFRQLARKKRLRPIDGADFGNDEPSIIDEIDQRQESRDLQAALNRLSDQCRTLLMAFYWEELSMEEIAVRFGFANAETAKSKKYQCKQALKKFLAR
jgi:RNA polymerase sigma factor (sigma-70 family)